MRNIQLRNNRCCILCFLLLLLLLIGTACGTEETPPAADEPTETETTAEVTTEPPCTDGAEALSGTYVFGETGSFTFDGNGRGLYVTVFDGEEHRYAFYYSVAEDRLLIDYENASVLDAEYRFTLYDDKILLVGGKGTNGGSFELQRKDAA